MLNGVSPKNRPLAALEDIFTPADIAYANLEIPLTNATTRTPRKSLAEVQARNQFILKADPAHFESLKNCGFTWVSLGNNHAMDYREAGLSQMMSLFDAAGIKHTGAGKNKADAEHLSIRVIKAGNKRIRVGLLSYLAFQTAGGRSKCTPATDTSAGVAQIDLNQNAITTIVHINKIKCDFLSVALHWGIERTTVPTPYQVALGRSFIDAGADLVIGSHPHVLQGAEIYRGKPILYSMGNLVSVLPSSTGLIRLTFAGKSLQNFHFIPCAIRGGRVSPVSRGVDFASLCRALRAKYPSKDSELPQQGKS